MLLTISCKKSEKEVPPRVFVGEGSAINNIFLSKSIQADSIGWQFDFYIRTEKGSKEISNLGLVSALPGGIEADEFIINDFTGDTTKLDGSAKNFPTNSTNYYHIYIKGIKNGTYRRLVRAYTGGQPGDASVTLQINN